MIVNQVINNIPMLHFFMTNILEMGLQGVNSRKAVNTKNFWSCVLFQIRQKAQHYQSSMGKTLKINAHRKVRYLDTDCHIKT